MIYVHRKTRLSLIRVENKAWEFFPPLGSRQEFSAYSQQLLYQLSHFQNYLDRKGVCVERKFLAEEADW